MSDELCAREGCGAPRAWHVPDTPIRQLREFSSPLHEYADIHVAAGSCMGGDCTCDAYLAPEPERKAYVVESDSDLAGQRVARAIPLDEYLAAHPQPTPALCICGGREDQHTEDGWCSHVVRHWTANGYLDVRTCFCKQYRPPEATS